MKISDATDEKKTKLKTQKVRNQNQQFWLDSLAQVQRLHREDD